MPLYSALKFLAAALMLNACLFGTGAPLEMFVAKGLEGGNTLQEKVLLLINKLSLPGPQSREGNTAFLTLSASSEAGWGKPHAVWRDTV